MFYDPKDLFNDAGKAQINILKHIQQKYPQRFKYFIIQGKWSKTLTQLYQFLENANQEVK